MRKSRKGALPHTVAVSTVLFLAFALFGSRKGAAKVQAFGTDDILQVTTARIQTSYPEGFCDTANSPETSIIKRPPFLGVLVPGVVFSFVGLAVVTDDYFVPSLERICERLQLSEDVAGATFMAAGSSAPELFTSILAVFVTQDDVGIGTIVGSAVFNILVIIGLSAALAGDVLELDFRPLIRDSFFYVLSIVLLLFFVLLFNDGGTGKAYWWEGLILMLGYACYILFMKFLNKPYMAAMGKRFNFPDGTEPSGPDLEGASEVAEVNDIVTSSAREDTTANDAVRRIVSSSKSAELVSRYSELNARSKFRALQLAVIAANEIARGIDTPNAEDGSLMLSSQGDDEGIPEKTCLGFELPSSKLGWVQFCIAFPWLIAFKLTIVNCALEKYAKYWWATFGVSILWIMGISYIMVEAARLAGCLIGIPASVMGLTVLAAGTSVPDALASVAVARNGQGDMAVSNAIGSNVFDILLGLGFPWFLGGVSSRTASITIQPITQVVVPIAILFCIIVVLVALLVAFKWKLSQKVGYLLFALYAVFVTYQLLDTFVISK